jgi:hypothetical protein
MHAAPDKAPEHTERQRELIAEIQRVARQLGVDRLSQREFDRHHSLASVTTVGHHFGSWNEAVVAAGLKPNPQGGSSREAALDADVLLQDILRVRDTLGELPSERRMSRFGKYSLSPYRDRWGTFKKARDAAVAFDQSRVSDKSAC